ncbi:NLRC3-like [Asbolus verrucosus]|uniref:NLRC3-like n=1 Tax=Asbolus verrucosus TaxID=1661398 RepID=A0A482VJW0_ASBVE|nr:NLRC3-like [Asbolus verrucosus]
MRIPVTINPNTIKTYYNEENKKVKKRVLQSNDLTEWDKNIPKNLQEICLEAIAQNWEANPVLDEITLTIDRCLLLNILSTNLPLKLTVPKISDDIYWKRCYLDRWPKLLPQDVHLDFQMSEIVKVHSNNSRKSSDVGNSNSKSRASSKSRHSSVVQQNSNERTWKGCFLETHIREYLEKLKPECYDAVEIKELSDLCGAYVKILNIRELQCSENSPSRIPLNAILTGLETLTELSLCFKQTYIGEKFTWDILKVTLQDIKLLSKGLEKCKLKVFRLRNSDIDDEKTIILLKSLLKHEDLQILDFSHCQISDDGAVALSKFSLQNTMTDLILANNEIGVKGAKALCYAICNNSCNLRAINLKLNPIMEKGGDLLMRALMMGARNIKSLFLSGCRLGKNNTSIGEMIEHNTSLEHLDLSNNAIGEETGKFILQGLRYNTTLKKLDVRMCKLNPANEFEILHKINQNGKNQRSSKIIRKPISVESQFNFEISDELLTEIENVFVPDTANITVAPQE